MVKGLSEGLANASQSGHARDGSVALDGNPVHRSKSGGWFACYFLVVYEMFERMAYYGITTNLVLYLTRVLHQGTVAAANNVTNWLGTVYFVPILGAYVADARLGRYWTVVLCSAIYFLGMCLLTTSVSVPSLKPPPCDGAKCEPASALQVGAFFGALYILAIGTGGTRPNISTIGADQFDDFDPRERAHKISFFNWWLFAVFSGTLFANIIITCASIVAGINTATQIGIICSICFASSTSATVHNIHGVLGPTLTVSRQGTTLDRHIGPHFQIPPASLSTFMTISMLVSLVVYDRLFMKCMRVWTKNPRGITPLQRIGTGLVLHIIAILVASLVEKKRLSIARDHGVALSGGEVPLTIFILLPQYVLLGVSECFYGVGKMEFFYIEAPQTMKSLGTSCALATYGVGNFLSSVLLSTVSKITKRNGHEGWILDNLDASHLDYYYVFLAVLGFLNFAFFLVLSKLYAYKAEAFGSKEVSAEEHHAANAHEETGT